MTGARALVAAAVAGLAPTERPNRVRVKCPLCELATGKADRHGAMSFETSRGWWKCHKCGAKGSLPGWGLDRADVDAPVEASAVREVEPPAGYYPLSEEPARSSRFADPAREYLRRRRVPERLWGLLRLGATLAPPPVADPATYMRVVVPVLDAAGRWVGWVARTWGAATPAYYTCPGMERARVLFNGAALVRDTADPLLVVEGVFDAIHAWPDGVAVLGKPTAAQEALLAASPRPVAVVLDGDAWEEAEMLALRLAGHRAAEGIGVGVGFVRLPPRTDPDEVPADELKRLARASIKENEAWRSS